MMARLMPPEISGIAIASDSRPSSGTWNISACSVVPRGNVVGSTSEKKATSSASRTNQAAEADRAATHPADQPIGVADDGAPLAVGNANAPSAARAR